MPWKKICNIITKRCLVLVLICSCEWLRHKKIYMVQMWKVGGVCLMQKLVKGYIYSHWKGRGRLCGICPYFCYRGIAGYVSRILLLGRKEHCWANEEYTAVVIATKMFWKRCIISIRSKKAFKRKYKDVLFLVLKIIRNGLKEVASYPENSSLNIYETY